MTWKGLPPHFRDIKLAYFFSVSDNLLEMNLFQPFLDHTDAVFDPSFLCCFVGPLAIFFPYELESGICLVMNPDLVAQKSDDEQCDNSDEAGGLKV